MNTRSICTKTLLALALAAALLPSIAQAAGLVGKRHVSAIYEWTRVESAAFDRGTGYSGAFNQPLSDALDLTASYAHAKKTSARPTTSDVEDNEFFLTGTFIGSSEDGIPFVRLGLGWAQNKSGGASTDAIMHSIEIGAELSAGRDSTVTPFANWRDSFDGKIDGALSYGFLGEIGCGRTCSVLWKLAGDDHFNVTGRLGLAVKF